MEDAHAWEKQIIPVYSRTHQNATVTFKPTKNVEYDDAIRTKIAKGTSGDIISCRPFDGSLALYQQGLLIPLNNSINFNKFRGIAKAAWATDDGEIIYCIPIAAVSHGIFYNKAIFEQLNLPVPQTESELFTAMEIIKSDGRYVPVAFGTKDNWEAAQVLLSLTGPNRWRGEEGRLALITGQQRFTDKRFVESLHAIARLGDFVSPDADQINHRQALDSFLHGNAAMYPSGSWDIALLQRDVENKIGVFMYPVVNPDDPCYVTIHLDMGMGIHPGVKNKKTAAQFLNWLSTTEFANAFANALPGFYPLNSAPVQIQNPLANEMFAWRKTCRSTIRIDSQYLNRGPDPLEPILWDVSTKVLRKTMKPEHAADLIQSYIAKNISNIAGNRN